MEQKEKFEKIWNEGDYRRGSTAQRLVPFLLEQIPEGCTINDYGCGTGRAEIEILQHRPDQIINMVDIARNALEFDVLQYKPLSFKVSDLSDLGEDFPKAEWGICINTLMVVQPEKLDSILSEIKRTCDNFIFEAYDLNDVRCGMNLTTIAKNKNGWEEKLKEFWQDVQFHTSKESNRRFIFVCKEKKC